jgi:hypothetical protein
MQVDIENTFNNVFQTTIFKKLHDARGPLANIIPLTRSFYGAHFSLYDQHGHHVEGVTIIESSSEMRQGGPLKGFLIYFGPLLNVPRDHHTDP